MSDTSSSNEESDGSEGRDYKKREYGSTNYDYSENQDESLGKEDPELLTWTQSKDDKFWFD